MAARGHRIFYSTPSQLFARGAEVFVRATPVTVLESEPWFVFHEEEIRPAVQFPLILMRKDPPVDQDYLVTTQLLSLLPRTASVLNDPRALRNWNEKLVILQFPRSIPPTLVSADRGEITRFVRSQNGIACAKPLEGFAGKGVRRLETNDPNSITAIDEMTLYGSRPIMVQRFLPEVAEGEKRIFFVDGRPLGALLKIPPTGSFLTNPDLGGHLAPTTLSIKERRICAEISPFLKKNNIFFAGVDMIGERLTEINITSPGLVWEWNDLDHRRHEEEIVDLMEKKIARSVRR